MLFLLLVGWLGGLDAYVDVQLEGRRALHDSFCRRKVRWQAIG
jgi:hypothetical protein